MTTEPREVVITPGKSALLIVGAEYDFVSPKGRLYVGPNTKARVDSMARFLARARAARMKVFFIHQSRPADSPEFSSFGAAPYLLEGTMGSEITEQLRPVFDEEVIEARTFDCFVKTNLERQFQRYDVRPLEDSIVVMGGKANVGIFHAASGLSQRHFRVVVPRDCVHGEKESEERIMRHISGSGLNYNTTVTTSDEIRIAESLGYFVKSY